MLRLLLTRTRHLAARLLLTPAILRRPLAQLCPLAQLHYLPPRSLHHLLLLPVCLAHPRRPAHSILRRTRKILIHPAHQPQNMLHLLPRLTLLPLQPLALHLAQLHHLRRIRHQLTASPLHRLNIRQPGRHQLTHALPAHLQPRLQLISKSLRHISLLPLHHQPRLPVRLNLRSHPGLNPLPILPLRRLQLDIQHRQTVPVRLLITRLALRQHTLTLRTLTLQTLLLLPVQISKSRRTPLRALAPQPLHILQHLPLQLSLLASLLQPPRLISLPLLRKKIPCRHQSLQRQHSPPNRPHARLNRHPQTDSRRTHPLQAHRTILRSLAETRQLTPQLTHSSRHALRHLNLLSPGNPVHLQTPVHMLHLPVSRHQLTRKLRVPLRIIRPGSLLPRTRQSLHSRRKLLLIHHRKPHLRSRHGLLFSQPLRCHRLSFCRPCRLLSLALLRLRLTLRRLLSRCRLTLRTRLRLLRLPLILRRLPGQRSTQLPLRLVNTLHLLLVSLRKALQPLR